MVQAPLVVGGREVTPLNRTPARKPIEAQTTGQHRPAPASTGQHRDQHSSLWLPGGRLGVVTVRGLCPRFAAPEAS
jgi:hypothetical protein